MKSRLMKKIEKRIFRIRMHLLSAGFHFFGSGIKKRINGGGNRIVLGKANFSGVEIDIEGSDNLIEVMDGCVLKNVTFRIRGDSHSVRIGKGCKFRSGATVWFEDDGGSLEIGDNSTFEMVSFAVVEQKSRIAIGKDCMFAYGIELRTSDSHAIYSNATGKRINYAQDIEIGDHVWVGANVMVLKGAEVADSSVVAACSVVARKFDSPNIVIGGNPAREIKSDISWSRKRLDAIPSDCAG